VLWVNTGAHVRFVVVDGGAVSYSFVAHTVHGVQLAAFSTVLYPSTQAPQPRSSVVLPGALTN